MNEIAEKTTTKLVTVEQRAALALGTTQTEKDLRALALKNVSIVEIKDKAGREQAHGAAMELVRTRTAIKKVSKEARDDATKFSKAVIEEENRLIAIIEPEEDRLMGLRDGWDNEQARIKAEAEAKERARITEIHEGISGIRAYVAKGIAICTSSGLQDLIDRLVQASEDTADKHFYAEFIDSAQMAFDETLVRLQEMRDQRIADELERQRVRDEATKVAAERAAFESERAAAQAEMDRAAELVAATVAKQQAEAKAQADALAAERAAFEAEKAAANAVETAKLAAERAAADAADFELKRAAMEAAVITIPQIAAPTVTEPTPDTEVHPNDADVVHVAVSGLCNAFGWSTEQAIGRLSKIDWSAV